MRIDVEGLDLAGKSTVAQYLAARTGYPYVKVRKGSCFVHPTRGSEREISSRIIDEIAFVASSYDHRVLDRFALSTLATGKLLSPSEDLEDLLRGAPSPDLGILVTVSPATLKVRSQSRALTDQDLRVLNGPYFAVQDWMRRAAPTYIEVPNDFAGLEDLYLHLQAEVLPHIDAPLVISGR